MINKGSSPADKLNGSAGTFSVTLTESHTRVDSIMGVSRRRRRQGDSLSVTQTPGVDAFKDRKWCNTHKSAHSTHREHKVLGCVSSINLGPGQRGAPSLGGPAT